MSKLLKALLAALIITYANSASAEAISANGRAEVSLKANKGDLIAARRAARIEAEADAIIAAIKLKLNVNPNDPKSKAAVTDMVKQLTDNLKTTYLTEGDIITAKTALEVDGAVLFDLAKSLNLGSKTEVAAAKVLFIIDEYAGIATALEPGQPVETEMEYSHDKTSFSDRSSKSASSEASGSSESASAKSASASSSKEASAISAQSASALKAKDAASFKGKDSASVNAKSSAALSAQDETGRASAAAASQYSGKSSTQVDARRSSELSAASSSKLSAASASQKSSAAASQSASSSTSSYASSSSEDNKDIQEQKDIVNVRVKTKFPDVANAKPSEGAEELVTARLEQVSQKFGIQFTSERDFRVEGGRRLLIKDIEKLGKFDQYLQKASKGSYAAKYLVYGTAVMNSEGKTSSGDVECTGQLKVQSTSVDTGASLVSGMINKRAVGTSDQSCKANLSDALATALAETIGTTAQREIQRTASQGSSYEVTLYSVLKVPAKVRRSFTEQLQKMAEEFSEGNSTETSRSFMLAAKGNVKTKIEDMMEDMKESFPEMKDARMEAKGNRVFVCIEGKCPEE